MRYAGVNGADLLREHHGVGEPLVLLHGGLGAGEQFAPLLAGFAGRRVITVDLPGHGGTPRPGPAAAAGDARRRRRRR